jgi:tetratricopeptide (TPR) repeat protein
MIRLGLLAILLAALTGIWLWRARTPTPEIPDINLVGADPDVADAVEAARRAVEHSPRSAAAWGHLAMVLHANIFEKSADESYAAAATLDPSNPEWPYLRGFLHQDGPGGPEVAIPFYQQSASLSPPNSLARLRLADMLLAQGRLEEADEEYSKVLSADSRDSEAQLGKGSSAIARRQYEEALKILEPLAMQPQVKKQACELLASAHERLGNPAEAERQRQRRAELPEDEARPGDPMTRVGELEMGLRGRLRKADTLRQQQLFDESIALLKDTVKRYPESDQAWSNLGAALYQMRDRAGAEEAARKCVELAPKSAEYHLNLGMLLLGQKRFSEAAETFRKSVELRPTLGRAHLGLGESLLGLKDREGALESLREALRYLPGDQMLKQRLKQLEQGAAEVLPNRPAS